MKKILAVLAAFATLFSLASCKVENNKTTAEKVSEAEMEQSMLVESSIMAETVREEKMVRSIEDIGKTQKGKQVVIKINAADYEHYRVYPVNKKGVCKKEIDYYFFDSIDAYNIKSKKPKVETRQKLIDADPEARMVVFESKYEEDALITFDQLYERFSNSQFGTLVE
ncbi:MAG: hypothetical protein IJE72_04435 [Clostridia bacterium]|nr:hypothetical protein [Clostridia bacterium]